MARRGVGAVHRLGSSLDLNSTARWKQKAWPPRAGNTRLGEARPAGGQGPGRPADPAPKTAR